MNFNVIFQENKQEFEAKMNDVVIVESDRETIEKLSQTIETLTEQNGQYKTELEETAQAITLVGVEGATVENTAEKIPDVFEGGRQKQESEFWEDIQKSGTRDNYIYCFSNWNSEYIRPKYKVVPTSTVHHLFVGCRKLKKIEAGYFDLSNVPLNYNSGAQGIAVAFNGCSELEEIEDIGIKAGYYYQVFSNCMNLKKIAKITVDEKSVYSDTFTRCDALEDITIVGVVGQNISFQWSINLSRESIANIIDTLSETATGKTITFSKQAVNDAFGIDVDDPLTYPAGSAYYLLRQSKNNWTFSYM